MNQFWLSAIPDLIKKLKEKNPLVHHLTNYVTVNDCANVTLAIGASPIMADSQSEVAEIVAIAQSLVINIGTLNEQTASSMLVAAKAANHNQIPVILDPVGIGASTFRTNFIRSLLEQAKTSVIRGNASEIARLVGREIENKGVDASSADLTRNLQDRSQIVQAAATKFNCIVAMTGDIDLVADKAKVVTIENGNWLLSKISGTGCMCSSLIGAYCGVADNPDYFLAVIAGLLTMSIAGELAADKNYNSNDYSSFRIELINQISKLTPDQILNHARLREIQR